MNVSLPSPEAGAKPTAKMPKAVASQAGGKPEPPELQTSVLTNLIEQFDGPIRIAVDTEFKDTHTLTVQFAVRIGNKIYVQVYHSPAIPEPRKLRLGRYLGPTLRALGAAVEVRPTKTLTRDLTPARVIADLFDLPGVCSTPSERVGWGVIVARAIKVVFVGHFLPADFFRMLGADFFSALGHRQYSGRLLIRANRLLGFRTAGAAGRFDDPELDRLDDGVAVRPVRVGTLDTSLPFGPASLEKHAQTFLGVNKLEGISGDDKRDMLATFRRKPARAYAYAILDAVLTLLIVEKMGGEHTKMHGALSLPGEPPKMQPTLGSRVTDAVVRAVARHAGGSVRLSRSDRPRADGESEVSLRQIRALMQRGGGDSIARDGGSKFGKQTAEAHGGLLYSRSPTEMFHPAPGMFRDVDLSGCYGAVISQMSLYVGQPVVYEPGARKMRLRDAVEYLTEQAAGTDAWIVKVSGPVHTAPNALIPSTNGALTHANYRSRAAKKRAGARRKGFVFDWLYQAGKETGNATLFTDVIEAGVVAWPTWLMIRALPPAVRREYEELEVETVLFYPKKLVADDGPEYDALVSRLAGSGAPWSAALDLDALRRVVTEEVGEEYAALRFDIGELARRITALRKEAKEVFGKNSGAELGWKVTVNSMYGVLASRHLVTNNVVAGNYVTATARAVAFAMQQALNGVQVITDGCTYRADQIPTPTFAECLDRHPDYPINRTGLSVPFHDPATVPADNRAFTDWYRRHVRQFFGAKGPEYDALFDMHTLEHKQCGPDGDRRIAFDGLCCDGSGNYIKLFGSDGGWRVTDADGFKARGYKREAKAALAPWIIRTYSEDQYTEPPPITESPTLVTYKEGGRLARTALRELTADEPTEGAGAPPATSAGACCNEPIVYYPLGLEQRRVRAYKVIKPSNFLFRTPRQREKYVRAMDDFFDETACGLELLALRRSSAERRSGSLRAIATLVYDFIRAGDENPSKALNLWRRFAGREIGAGHKVELDSRKRDELERLIRLIDARQMSEHERLTGWYVTPSDVITVE